MGLGTGAAVSAGAGALGAVTGAISMFTEAKNKKKIAKEIGNLKENPLDNIADGMQVSTLGSDLQKQEQAKLAATQTSALQDGGTRPLLAGLGAVTAGNQNVNAQIAANLDDKKNQIVQVRAQDKANIRATKEQRQANKLAALGSQYNASSQNATQGMANIIQGVGMAGNAFANSDFSAKGTNAINKKLKIDPTTGRNIYAV
jgi:hypothetical protein